MDLQEELEKAKLALQEKTEELNDLKNDGNKVLHEIKSECEKLNTELMGIRMSGTPGGAGDNSMGLMEKTTIREMLEEMTMQLKMLDPEWEELGQREKLMSRDDSCLASKFGDARSIGEEIRSNTDAEEQALLSKEVDSIVSAMPKLFEGALGKEKSISSILQPSTNPYSFEIQIGNYLDANICNLDYIWPAGSALQLPHAIKAGTREAMTVSNPSTWINGQFSYRIPKLNLSLFISLAQSSGQVFFALAPAGLPLSGNAFQIDGGATLWRTMADKRWNNWADGTGAMEMIVGSGNALARVRFTGGKSSAAQIDVVRVDDNFSATAAVPSSKCRGTIVDGKTIVGKKVTRVSEYVLESYGYVVEIVNLLQVPLNEPLFFMENAQQPFLRPDMVSSGSREVVVVKMDYSGRTRGGIASFRIGMTDLRLAVVFQLFNNGNKYGAAFVPANVAHDANLMLFLSSENQWKTSPDQVYAQAKDGERIIQTRNIRAKASMSSGMKAVIKVVIKAT